MRLLEISYLVPQIAFSHTPDPLINSFFNADISVLKLVDTTVQTLVSHPSADFLADWSPDGQSILYSSDLDNRSSNYYKNGQLFIQSLNSGIARPIAQDFDENLGGLEWTLKFAHPVLMQP